jgi:hypothetical protein
MIQKRLILTISSLFIVLTLILSGCNAREEVGKITENVKESGKGIVNKVTDTSMEYSNNNFNKELEQKGYKLNEGEMSTTNFSVQSKNYTLNGEKITVYEYDTKDGSTLESDLSRISSDGTTINGTKMEWAKAPHIYKKGRIVVVYDGNSESVLTTLKDLLGAPLIG